MEIVVEMIEINFLKIMTQEKANKIFTNQFKIYIWPANFTKKLKMR